MRNIYKIGNWIKVLIYIAFATFLIGFLVLFSICYFQYNNNEENKNIKLNPIQYLIKSFKYVPQHSDTTNSKDSTKSTLNKDIIIIKPGENTTSDILEDTSNILGDTSNILTYFTLILLVISIFVTIGVYKWITEIKKLREGVEAADRNILDSALTTISAVPFIEATQITSSEYYRAIDNITKTVKEKRDIINNEPKYAPLLIVEALDNWKNRDYDNAIKNLKKAYKFADIAHDKKQKQEIAYHLARAYKQRGYEKYKENRKNDAEKDFNISKDWASKMKFDYYKNLFELTIIIIKSNNQDIKILENIIIKCFEGYNSLNNILINYENEKIILSDISKITAMSIILLNNEIKTTSNKSSDNSQKNNNLLIDCKKKFLKFIQNEVNNWKGLNIKASWYHTMYRIAEKSGIDEEKDYKVLFQTYKEQAKKSGIEYLFDCCELVEKPIKKISIN